MARPKKHSVDYFPHDCDHGPTMFILERKFGLKGYCCWFKILEVLGRSNGHYFDTRKLGNWEFLQAHTHLDEQTLKEIIDLLAKLEAIDEEIWTVGVIWSDNFVKGLADVYRKRGIILPCRPMIVQKTAIPNDEPEPESHADDSFCPENSPTVVVSAPETGVSAPETGVSAPETPQSKVNKITPPTPPKRGGWRESFEKWKAEYPPERSQGWQGAEKVWRRLWRQGRLPPIEEMLAVLERQQGSQEWQRELGRFIPRPRKYLEDGRFDDKAVMAREPPPVKPLILVTRENAHRYAWKDCPECGGKGLVPDQVSIKGRQYESEKPCECTQDARGA